LQLHQSLPVQTAFKLNYFYAKTNNATKTSTAYNHFF
jgi:hypothetical protein